MNTKRELEYQRQWRAKNQVKIKGYRKAYSEKNRDKIATAARIRRLSKTAEHRLREAIAYRKHPENRRKRNRRFRLAHPNYHRAYGKAFRQRNPEYFANYFRHRAQTKKALTMMAAGAALSKTINQQNQNEQHNSTVSI